MESSGISEAKRAGYVARLVGAGMGRPDAISRVAALERAFVQSGSGSRLAIDVTPDEAGILVDMVTDSRHAKPLMVLYGYLSSEP